MHRIFATEGIVLAKNGAGEANTLVTALTRDLGLLRIAARSARFERSKLRYGLEPLMRGRFSLVRGRHEWKLTGSDGLSSEYVSRSLPQRRALGRIARLLLRLIHGEEPVPELYDTLREGFAHLARAGERESEGIECVLVLRLLSHLGYLPHTPELVPFIEGSTFSEELHTRASRSRAYLVRAINESLSATGL